MSEPKKNAVMGGVDALARSLIRQVQGSARASDPKDKLTFDQRLDAFKELTRWVMILHRLEGTPDEGTAIDGFRNKVTPGATNGTHRRAPGVGPLRERQLGAAARDIVSTAPGNSADTPDGHSGNGAARNGEAPAKHASDVQGIASYQRGLEREISFAVGNSVRRPPVFIGDGQPRGDDAEDDDGGGV